MTNKKNRIDRIELLLRKGEIEGVIKEMEKDFIHKDFSEFSTDIVQLSSRNNFLKKDIRSGVLNQEDIHIQRNQIVNSLIEIVKELKLKIEFEEEKIIKQDISIKEKPVVLNEKEINDKKIRNLIIGLQSLNKKLLSLTIKSNKKNQIGILGGTQTGKSNLLNNIIGDENQPIYFLNEYSNEKISFFENINPMGMGVEGTGFNY